MAAYNEFAGDDQRLASRVLTAIRNGVVRAGEAIVPGSCIICDAAVEEQGGCCADCWRSMRFISQPMCPVMGTPFSVSLGDGMLSAEAIANPPPFNRLRAAVLYDDNARKLISGLKFADRSEFARWMAGWMITAGGQLLADRPLIVPVPLHRRRLFSRRYNQSAELARHIARKTGLRDRYEPETLARARATRQQVGLSQGERERNVSGVFRVSKELKGKLSGARILLVDDVYTTGATAKAATRALKRAGASHVDVLVFAMVETKGI